MSDAGEEKKEDFPAPSSSGSQSMETSNEQNANPAMMAPPDNTPPPSTTTTLTTNKTNASSRLLWKWVSFSTHVVLAVLFLAWASVYCLRSIHDDYFVPLVERARRTDDDLLDEFTYYERDCNVVDITAAPEDANELYIGPNSKNHGVDQMMTHGAVLFPDLLTPATVQDLRQFIADKNAAVRGTTAEFPVSQGHKRISYGIEATEHPAVITALREIHDKVELKDLLEGLIGVNPALTEITAITAGYGARYQAWHPDVKPDGNGLLFGRTYSHSYSLFITLQNTTGEMGATDLCPGTHYCASMELHDLCEEHKIGMHQISGQGHWPSGSAMLLNQQVWHRGGKHTDVDREERIVFIVSFLARPNDTRQLSRGTYFHMKWNMWGHTWNDLGDSARYMSWPWDILTCLHIWRREAQGWGYDLITSAALRIGNMQLGCQPEDLESFLGVMEKIGFPEFLDGTIDLDHDEAWQIYIRESIANTWDFLTKVNIAGLGAYFAALVIIATRFAHVEGKSRLSTIWNGSKWILFTHILIAIAAIDLLMIVRRTPWAQDLSSGLTLMRPFAAVKLTWATDPSVSKGLTTFPNRQDVLFGSRLDTKTIGAYNRWLEFHPGNVEFLKQVTVLGGPFYRSYERGLPPVFTQALVYHATESIVKKGGRFLQQDYRTGDWLVLQPDEQVAAVREVMYVGTEGGLYEIRRELDFMLGEHRFGFTREQGLSRTSLAYLRKLEVDLFGDLNGADESIAMPRAINTKTRRQSIIHPDVSLAPEPSTIKTMVATRDWGLRWTKCPLQDTTKFVVGEEVFVSDKNSNSDSVVKMQTTLIDISDEGQLDVAFYAGDVNQNGVARTVPRLAVTAMSHMTTGSLVLGNFKDRGEWFPGVIKAIRPNGWANIQFDDGDFEEGVERDHYRPR